MNGDKEKKESDSGSTGEDEKATGSGSLDEDASSTEDGLTCGGKYFTFDSSVQKCHCCVKTKIGWGADRIYDTNSIIYELTP